VGVVAVKDQHDDFDDGLPDTLNPEEMTDKRYMGGHIPSKVFKHLQKVVGDDTPEAPPKGQSVEMLVRFERSGGWDQEAVKVRTAVGGAKWLSR
jgi:hypothetical protein